MYLEEGKREKKKGKFFFFGREKRLKRAMYGELSRSIPRSGRIMNRADNKSVPPIYIYILFHDIFFFSSYHPPSTSSSGWKILRREKGTAITMPSCPSLLPPLLIITRLDARATRLRFNNLLVSLMITSLLICSLTFSEIAHPRAREKETPPSSSSHVTRCYSFKKKKRRRRTATIHFLIASRSSHRIVSTRARKSVSRDQ